MPASTLVKHIGVMERKVDQAQIAVLYKVNNVVGNYCGATDLVGSNDFKLEWGQCWLDEQIEEIVRVLSSVRTIITNW